MRKLRDILRLRQIKSSLRLSLGAVQKVASRAQALGLDWAAIDALNDQQLARLIYPASDVRVSNHFQLLDWAEVLQELKRKGVTKHLLWEEYTQAYPNRSYSYAQYCFLYQDWLKKQRRSMRQVHQAGDKLFVDYAGQTVPIVCGDSGGEIRFAQILLRCWAPPITPIARPHGPGAARLARQPRQSLCLLRRRTEAGRAG